MIEKNPDPVLRFVLTLGLAAAINPALPDLIDLNIIYMHSSFPTSLA